MYKESKQKIALTFIEKFKLFHSKNNDINILQCLDLDQLERLQEMRRGRINKQ